MVFLTNKGRHLRDAMVYLRTAISMARSENVFADLDSRISHLEEYFSSIQATSELAREEKAEEYINALMDMASEVESMLEEARKKKKKRRNPTPSY